MKITYLSVFFALSIHLYAEPDLPGSWNSALPLQAAVCDVAGIGRALSQNATNAVIQVDRLWYGSSSNGVLTISNRDQHNFPTNGVPFVFFLSRYSAFFDLEPAESHFAYIFDMNEFRSEETPDGIYLYSGNRSWFPVTPESEQMVTWCSNLVYTSQVSVNTNAFYELIRDGYRQNPESSRIHRDSEYAFMYFHYYMTTNLMQQIWSDTNLVGWARSWVNNSYRQKTKNWLPE